MSLANFKSSTRQNSVEQPSTIGGVGVGRLDREVLRGLVHHGLREGSLGGALFGGEKPTLGRRRLRKEGPRGRR